MKMKSTIIFFILFAILVGCSEKSARRIRKKNNDDGEHRGVEGLNGDRKALYDNLINLTKEDRSNANVFEPIDGDSFSYITKFEIPRRQKFKLTESNKECLFEYTSLKIDELIQIDNEEFKMTRVLSPIEPVYIGLPVADRKRKCIDEKSELNVTKKSTTLDLKKQALENRKMIRKYFLDILETCKAGKEITGIGKCDELEILNFEERADGRKDGDSIYYFKGKITSAKNEYEINIVFSLRDISWGFGGLLLWESKSFIKSQELKFDIINFQADSSF